MDAYSLDCSRSKLTLRTRAKGLLSALAHDLELVATPSRGEVRRDGDTWEGELAVPPSAIEVVGQIKGGKREELPAWEIKEVKRRILEEVFGGLAEIVVRVKGTERAPEVHVRAKREGRAKVRVELRDEGTAVRAHGSGTVSMKDLGLAEVKAPLNAFTVRDDIEVDGEVVLVRA